MLKNLNIPDYSKTFSIFLHDFVFSGKSIFKNFNISTNNIISVQAIKAPWY
jgi:hypothetical protein